MDIYVVMNKDDRTAVVCGAAADWDTACDLANSDRDPSLRQWTGWSGEGADATSRRYALGPSGDRLHTQQVITRLPLAGMALLGRILHEAARMPVAYKVDRTPVTADAEPTRADVLDAIGKVAFR